MAGVSYYGADQQRKAANEQAKINAIGQATAAGQFTTLVHEAAIVAVIGVGIWVASKAFTAEV
jgi:hypothetical protein